MRRRRLVALAGIAVASAPALGRAQQSRRIGILTLTPGERTSSMAALLARLDQLGHSEGRNLIVDYASADGQADRLPQLAASLAARKPDVIVTGFGTLTAKAAKAATSTIPVVFVTVGDPVGAGLVASLAKPGGNVTGLTDQASEAAAKRLDLMRAITGGSSFSVLLNPETPYSALALKVIESAAAAQKLTIRPLGATTADEALKRVASVDTAAPTGLLVLEDALTTGLRREIAEVALKSRLATSFQTREGPQVGALMSYGADRHDLYVRAADYVDRILKGARPGDLPVEQPTKFELVLNQRTASTLGLTLPRSILAAADEVIE
jgi:putative tryptophan/tyrosine transport system substrate-binding protein